MISIETAREKILLPLVPLGPEILAVSHAAGRVLAGPILARRTQPPADVSAMDGYAVRSTDAAAPRQIIGSAPAGHPFAGSVGQNQAVRLFTGSVIPPGADAVLLQEDAVCAGDTLTPTTAITAHQHIRPQGQDFATGTALLAAGRVLTSRDIGLAAAANHPWLTVHRRPRVAILSTGDEIALPGEPIPTGGIVSSNSAMLAALINAAGGDPIVLPNVADSPAAIADAIRGTGAIDLLVTTGGASVGDHDAVRAGLDQLGFALGFWKIAMRPGKPMIFGHLGATPVLGLPGNPVSAFVCAVLFLLPALWRLGGRASTALLTERAILGADLRANDHRADHLRATLLQNESGAWIVTANARQDSAMMRVLAAADALILRPPHAPAAAAGTQVPIIRLSTLGI